MLGFPSALFAAGPQLSKALVHITELVNHPERPSNLVFGR